MFTIGENSSSKAYRTKGANWKKAQLHHENEKISMRCQNPIQQIKSPYIAAESLYIATESLYITTESFHIAKEVTNIEMEDCCIRICHIGE